jgi:hypothetical protein
MFAKAIYAHVQYFLHKQISTWCHGYWSRAGYNSKIIITNKQHHYFSIVYFKKDLGQERLSSVLKYILCDSKKWRSGDV